MLSGLRDELGNATCDEQRVQSLVLAAREHGVPEPSIQQVLAERTQVTANGVEIPVPSREDFDALVRKVAPPEGRKRLGEIDRPPGRSE